jgi:preprotein translocase subunit YajC
MHLLLSFPEHLATEAEFIAAASIQDSAALAETAEPSDENDDDDEDVSTAGVVLQLAIFILIPVAMYFLLIRPRRRMMKEQQAVQRSIEIGDEVLLTSGMYGFVTGFEEGSDVVWVEIDDDVQVRLTRAGISGKVSTPAGGGDAGAPEPSGRPTLKGGAKADAAERVEPADPVEE